jgi:hypothetical protein
MTSEQMNEVNRVLREHFNGKRYMGHIDHLMLFNMAMSQANSSYTSWTDIDVIFVRTLNPILHELFIPSKDLAQKIGNHREITLNDVYDSYPSIRFNKFFRGTYVDFESPDSMNLKFGIKEELSHKLNTHVFELH